jgi:5-methylcytosine-specific restriction endonuclease McrA
MDRATREFVWQRARGLCEYCRMPQRHDPLPFQIDHIISLKHGGADEPDNLVACC